MKTYSVQVRVRLKEGILDPQAEAILEGLKRLEFSSIKSLRCEKLFVLEIESETSGQAVEQARKMAHQLLANLVMEDFEVECLE